jgi:hypothetical protein
MIRVTKEFGINYGYGLKSYSLKVLVPGTHTTGDKDMLVATESHRTGLT